MRIEHQEAFEPVLRSHSTLRTVYIMVNHGRFIGEPPLELHLYFIKDGDTVHRVNAEEYSAKGNQEFDFHVMVPPTVFE